MKTKTIVTTAIMALAIVSVPVNAQSHKDKKAAKKAQWEMEQQHQREEAELRHKLRMDSIANAGKVAEEAAAKEEAERRQRELDAQKQAQKAAEAAALQEVEYSEPCMEWESTSEFLRARGIGEDLDHQFSVDLARTAAITELGSMISTKINAMLIRNRKQAKKGLSRESLQKAEDMVLTEIDQTMGYNVACRKTMTYVENGNRVFKTYIVVEVEAEKLLKPIFNGLQEDKDLQLDMNFDEFKQEFEKRF